jgi:hypothetical protein
MYRVELVRDLALTNKNWLKPNKKPNVQPLPRRGWTPKSPPELTPQQTALGRAVFLLRQLIYESALDIFKPDC